MINQYSQLSDNALADLIRKLDQNAFAEIYNRHWGVLFRYARRMLKNDEEAGDVVQDIFTQLWEKATEINPELNVAGWLYTAMRNQIISKINRNKRHEDYVSSLGDYLEKGEYQTDDKVREKEFAAIIAREVEKLPAKMREVFMLSREAHLSHKAIAAELNISETTVKKQVANALKILRSRLGHFVLFLLAHTALLIGWLFF